MFNMIIWDDLAEPIQDPSMKYLTTIYEVF